MNMRKYFYPKILWKLLGLPSFSALWLLTFALVRTIIEFELQNSFSLASFSSIAHAVSYFLLCYVVTLLVLRVGLRREMSEAFKWTNVVFIFLPFPPIIDYLFSSKIHLYQYADRGHLLGNLISFFSKYGDASLGQQALGIYIVIVTFTVIYITRRRIIPALAAPLFLYTFSVFASVDWIRGLLPSGSYDSLEARFMASRILHQGYTFFYVSVSVLFVSIWWLIRHRETFPSLIASIRPVRSFHMVQMGIFGLLTSSSPTAPEMFWTNVICITPGILMTWWLTAFINDYSDLKIDKISNSSRFHTCFPGFSRQLTSWISWLGICSFMVVMSLGIVPLILWALYILGGMVYSLPPIRFRRNILGSSFIGLGSANLYLLGSTAYIAPNSNWQDVIDWTSALLILLGFGLSAYIKDEKDRTADRMDGVNTLFTRFEYKKARKWVWFLLLVGWIIISRLSVDLLTTCLAYSSIAVSVYFYHRNKPATWQIALFQCFFIFLNVHTLMNKNFIADYIVW